MTLEICNATPFTRNFKCLCSRCIGCVIAFTTALHTKKKNDFTVHPVCWHLEASFMGTATQISSPSQRTLGPTPFLFRKHSSSKWNFDFKVHYLPVWTGPAILTLQFLCVRCNKSFSFKTAFRKSIPLPTFQHAAIYATVLVKIRRNLKIKKSTWLPLDTSKGHIVPFSSKKPTFMLSAPNLPLGFSKPVKRVLTRNFSLRFFAVMGAYQPQ